MSKLNKAHIYAINWLNYLGKDIDTIASELNLTTKQISSVIEKNQTIKDPNKKDAIKTASESAAKKIISKNLMINQTNQKKNNNVMIMTKEASIINDELKKNTPSTLNRNSSHIFRPNDKKRK